MRPETRHAVHRHARQRPQRLQQVVRRLEQVVESLRIREPDLVHRRDRDRVLVVLLQKEQVAVAVIPGDKIENPVLLNGMPDTSVVADSGINSPLPTAGALVHDTCVTRLRVLRYIALPGNLLLIVEIHADLPQAMGHQVVHHEGILFNPVVHGDGRRRIAFHVADGHGFRGKLAVGRKAVHAFPAVHLHAHP